MTTEPPAWLLITGVPGSGKSRFLHWIEGHQGFRVARVDDEKERQLIEPVLGHAVQGALDEAKAALRRLGERVAIEYGFPPDRGLPHVEALRRVEMSCWWFDADYPAALKAYRAREAKSAELDHKMDVFYRQIGAIAAHRPEIERLFKGRIIETLIGDRHLPPEEIWTLIVREARPR